jgi:small subunit ribosomal protein S11
MPRPRARRRERRVVPQGRAYIYSTFNNTLVSITDPDGNVIASASAGTSGFRGSRKGTAFAAQRAAEQAGRRGTDMGLRQIDIYIRGPGAGREAAIRSLQGVGLVITSIRDVTPIPHNGCRPPKRRRV